MGLFDKIMKAVEGLASAEVTKPQEKVAKAEEKALAQQPKPKAPPKPACDKGECVVCEADGFNKCIFFSCDKDIKCSKKDKYPTGDLWDKDFLPVIKAFATFQKSSSWESRQKNLRSAANKLIKTYVPQLSGFDFANFVGERMDIGGVTSKNHFVVYLVNLNRRGVEIPESKKTAFQNVAKIIAQNYLIDPNSDWLYNPSLYDNKWPSYTVGAFARFSNKKWLNEHLLDTSVVDIKQFYNEDGSIKEAGSDGREGDTIYNVIEKWCNGNENLETFERERREKMEAEEKEKIRKMCNSCKKYSFCSVKGMRLDCPAFEPSSPYGF